MKITGDSAEVIASIKSTTGKGDQNSVGDVVCDVSVNVAERFNPGGELCLDLRGIKPSRLTQDNLQVCFSLSEIVSAISHASTNCQR